MVPVECVPKARWVNIPYGANSSGSQSSFMDHAQICAAVGMKAANLGGKTCASGERRPTLGEKWESINYRYGKKGDGNGGDGGDKLILVGGYTAIYNRDDYGGDRTPTYRQMCYDNRMGARNNTKQDAAVAVYCEERWRPRQVVLCVPQGVRYPILRPSEVRG